MRRFTLKKSILFLASVLLLPLCFALSVSASNARCDYMTQCNVTAAHEQGLTGKYEDGTPVRVVVIDSGIDYRNFAFYDEDGNCLISPLSYNASTKQVAGEAGYTVIDDQAEAEYHGTSVCGTIISRLEDAPGVAPDVELIVVRLDFAVRREGADPIFATEDALHAVEYAISLDPDVISISWSISKYDTGAHRLEELMQQAYENNILVCVSAGNTDSADLDCPANVDSVLTVGWVDENDVLADNSCFGPGIDLVAPGSIVAVKYNGGVWHMDGTSFSCPITAGIAALYISTHPDATVDEITDALCSTARDLGEFGRDNYYGCGIPDAFAACMSDRVSLTLICGDTSVNIKYFAGDIEALNDMVGTTEGVFAGWYYDASCTQPVSVDDDFLTDTTLYAGIKYTWTLYDGYVDVIASVTDFPGTALTYPEERVGFTCWTEDEMPEVLGTKDVAVHLFWSLQDLTVQATPTSVVARENSKDTDTFTFDVTHPLGDGITYTWTKDGVVLPGETTNTLTLWQSQNNSGEYVVTATLTAGGQTRTESCAFTVTYVPERRLPWVITPLALLAATALCVLYAEKNKKKE